MKNKMLIIALSFEGYRHVMNACIGWRGICRFIFTVHNGIALSQRIKE